MVQEVKEVDKIEGHLSFLYKVREHIHAQEFYRVREIKKRSMNSFDLGWPFAMREVVLLGLTLCQGSAQEDIRLLKRTTSSSRIPDLQ